jgi:hypothetical protein
MDTSLTTTAPAFVAMAHGIGYAVVATVGRDGTPRTRVMQPVWEWDGTSLVGWASTVDPSPKTHELAAVPVASLTYWSPSQDTCTATVVATPVTDPAAKAEAWARFLATPEPAGFDPAIHPAWESPSSPTFGVLRLDPRSLRVQPGSLMLTGEGEILTWRAGAAAPAAR